MGGDDSQKLRPRRRLSFLSGAQQTFRRIANSILYIKGFCSGGVPTPRQAAIGDSEVRSNNAPSRISTSGRPATCQQSLCGQAPPIRIALPFATTRDQESASGHLNDLIQNECQIRTLASTSPRRSPSLPSTG